MMFWKGDSKEKINNRLDKKSKEVVWKQEESEEEYEERVLERYRPYKRYYKLYGRSVGSNIIATLITLMLLKVLIPIMEEGISGTSFETMQPIINLMMPLAVVMGMVRIIKSMI